MKQLTALGLATLLAVLAPLAHAATAPAPASKTFAKTVPASRLSALHLDAAVGQVHVKTGNTDTVRIRATARPGMHMHFIFDWTYGNNPAHTLPEGLHLVTRRTGSRLLICLAPRERRECAHSAAAASATGDSGTEIVTPVGNFNTGSRHHRSWKADWTIVVPPRLALALEVGVGDAEVDGVGGGVSAQMGVGHLDARLPRGPLAAHVGVGHIEASVGSADYGKVDLSSGVGHVSFEVGGKEIRKGLEKHAASGGLHTHGNGTIAYTLESGVGHVELKLGVPDLARPGIPASTPGAATVPTEPATAPASPASAASAMSAPAGATGAH